MPYYRDNGDFTYNGKRYRFEWHCSYMGTVDYMVTDETGTFRAELRIALGDYERSVLNYRPEEIGREVEATIGMLRRCVCDNRGEILPDTIAAFNAWNAAEHARLMAHMRADPARYGTDFSEPWFQAPTPVYSGFWERGKGWTRIEPQELAA